MTLDPSTSAENMQREMLHAALWVEIEGGRAEAYSGMGRVVTLLQGGRRINQQGQNLLELIDPKQSKWK